MATMVTAPAGMSGLAVRVWGDTYAVAADWSQASAPVLVRGEDGWTCEGRQVADYGHSSDAALRRLLAETMEASGDEASEKRIDKIMARAETI